MPDAYPRNDTGSKISVEVPLVLPYWPAKNPKDLWLEVRKRRIEAAFERSKHAQHVLETRVLLSDIPDIFPSFCLCYLAQLPIEDVTSQERRTLLIGGAIEYLLRAPAELLLDTQAFEAQWRSGLKSCPLADAFAKSRRATT